MPALLSSSRLIVAGVIPHCIGILCTIFRLFYRVWTHRFWWEDAWAAFALITDVVCLACMWIDSSITSWTLIVTFTSVLWAARMSVIFSIIRVTKDSGSKVHRQITNLIAVSFACMWAAILAQKMSVCAYHACQMGQAVALSQLITDVVADVSLVAVPLHLWKNVGLSRGRKILILSTISSSLLITVVTIAHSSTLFRRTHSSNTLIFAHIKAALSLVICNLLVIVTFAYRVCARETFDLDKSFKSDGLFTSIVVMQHSSGMSAERPREGTNLRQIMTAQTGATEQHKMEDTSVLYVEDGTKY
ncbi:hypothetical protein K503DRAFT_869481 [Rhizopogon vinicolor AM-OR11-026]|uniref:Integral membrane protein n=1 Tax=Rhizopogon vinicolor AM-OR11-026 TaxID=1314800 RepID=A0A1B7MLR5_9AGAM|nr:hypothetical protein K503DRAFT_869481 [Rhizopogon vinicolor AM-OR11-026]